MPKVMNMPKIGVNMTDAKIVEWVVKEGDTIKEGDHILDAETDKAVQEIYATMSGVVAKLLVEVGEDVLCQSPVAVLVEPGEKWNGDFALQQSEPQEEGKPAQPAKADAAAGSVPAAAGAERIRISPLARKLAKDRNIDITRLKPPGYGKRITKADVLGYAASLMENNLQTEKKTSATLPYTGIRKLIGERMTESTRTKPPVSLTLHADAGRLAEWRDMLKKAGKATGYTEMLVMIAARVLKEQPIINSRLAGNTIELLEEVNVGVAVDTEKGLMVPVIKNADKKGLMEIGRELKVKAEAARSGKALVEDLTGGTFTVTNLGMYEIEHFVPILNPPECCILGVGAIIREPVAGINDTLEIRPRMQLTLVFDHRIVDGAPAARFLQKIKHYIEWPLDLMS